MSTNTKEYNRVYAREHRPEILKKRKERYWTDPQYRDMLLDKTRVRRAISKRLRVRIRDFSYGNEKAKIIAVGDKNIKIFTKSVFAKKLGLTNVTIDNWHKWNILPVPQDIDTLGRYWYREDYIRKVDAALGKYQLKLRKEVIAERIKRAFSASV